MTKQARIAYQGAPGAFSHQAALVFSQRLSPRFDSFAFIPCQTFGEVFENVTSGAAEFGAIPLENSSIGSIAANYDLLWVNDAFLVDEHFLPVHHNLIGFPGASVDDIRIVYSHPAALDQCRKMFKEHPNMVARVHWDTSGSVADVKTAGDRTAAAIAGELAASEYSMAILLPNIEDFEHNATRFGLIEKTAAGSDAKRGAIPNHKVSYALELSHKVGSLAAVLEGLAAIGANLTKIESRPIGETPWHYRFFIDIELSSREQDEQIRRLLEPATERCKKLGLYPSALQKPPG